MRKGAAESAEKQPKNAVPISEEPNPHGGSLFLAGIVRKVDGTQPDPAGRVPRRNTNAGRNKERMNEGKMANKMKRFLSLALALLMVLSMVPQISIGAKAAAPTTIYLKPGDWSSSNAWFAARFWNSAGNESWKKMTDTDGDGVYECEVPSGYTYVIITRNDPSKTALYWSSKWNQSGDLTIPTDGKNCWSPNGGWDGATGVWSTYTYVEPTFIVAGTPKSVFGNEWKPEDTTNAMTKNADGLYEKVYTNVAVGTVSFKVTDGSWTNSWGKDGGSDNYDVSVTEAGSTVTITFNASTKTVSATVTAPAKEYQVGFDTNGGSTVDSQTVEEGSTVTKPADPTKDGYTFDGWYSNEELTTAYDFSTLVTADLTLYAKWTEVAATTSTIYLDPGIWAKDGAWFSAKVDGEMQKMTDVDADGVYEVTVPVDAASITFYRNDPSKTAVAESSAWNNSGTLTVGGVCYTVTNWSDGTWSDEVSVIPYTVAGASGLCGKHWDHTTTANDMTKNSESGLYEKTFENVGAGTYEYKVVANHSWDVAWGSGESNKSVTVETAGSTVTVTFDRTTGTVDAKVTAPTSGGEGGDTTTDYYLVGYINGADYSGEDYKFVDGKVTVKFTADSYVVVKDSAGDWYLAEQYCTDKTVTLTKGKSEKMFVAKDIEYTFTLVENSDGTLTLSYAAADEDDDDDDTEKTTYTAIFHFANDTVAWSPLYLYVWNDDGATTGSWPGSAVTKKDDDGYYTATVSWEGSANKGLNYIFSNGSSQTVDLKLDTSYFDATTNTAEVWLQLNSAANSDGKYEIKQIKKEKLTDVVLAVSPRINGTTVTFEYVNGSATSVEVRGTVTGASWSSGIAMSKNDKGIWTATVENLTPAVYEYKFVVNGETWTTDPANGKTNSNGNSVFTIVDPNAVDTNTININVYYDRADDIYTQANADGTETGTWNAYVWGDGISGTRYDFAADTSDKNGNGDKDEMVTTITVEGRATQNVYLKPRMSTASKDWLREESQVSIPLDNIVSGTINVYVVSDGQNGNAGNMTYSVVTGTDIVTANKITDVQYDYAKGTVIVTTMEALSAPKTELGICNTKDNNDDIAIASVKTSGNTYTLTLNKELDLATLSQYKITYGGYGYDIGIDNVYATDKFADEYTYDGDDLGATWTSNGTTFKVWAPTATEVSVKLYKSGTAGTDDLKDTVAMTKGEKGVWYVTVDGDLNGTYYTYAVTFGDEEVEAVDPYARTTGVNGNRGMVINLDSTDPAGWASDTNPNPLTSYTDAVIYELHVRDFSIDDSSGVSATKRGKYLAFTETGTTTSNGTTTGIDYLDDLGVTHVHLLPVYDYASVDETTSQTFNWGYDPQNYNTPEGSYSTNPYDGAVRVKEFKQMVKSLHDHDISVIMDVVYNHVYNADTFCFNNIVPGYFSRVDSNTSGCGNDTASEREMVRKYIVESVCYWADEYHIDGFRFDLVGLLDVETINQIVTEVHAVRPDVIFYGEGWDMDSTNKEEGTQMAKQGNSSKTHGFAYFSDSMRNGIGGNNGNSTGFASGAGNGATIAADWLAKPWWTTNPQQVVQYASCHDNYTLVDKIIKSTGKSAIDSTVIKMNNLAAAYYMTAQGIPFIHAGEEFLREKLTESGSRVENSYNSSDYVNHLEWSNLDNATYKANSEYYKGLIAFRAAHPALRYSTAAEVAANVTSKEVSAKLLTYRVDGNGAKAKGETSDIFVIFNANTSSQTVTLPDGEWTININGTKAGTESLGTATGSVSVAGISAMVLTKADEGEDGDEPLGASTEKTLYFSNNKGWEKVYAYAWTDGGETYLLGAWPGSEMTYVETNDYDEKIYSITLPASDTGIEGVIFHNNSGEQTVDIEPGIDGTGYYCTDQNDEGKYQVGTYTYRAPNLGSSDEYFLVGYINSTDYVGGDYKFDADGKVTVTFDADSYVYVVNGDNSETYMTDGYQGAVTSATMYDTAKHTLTADKWDKLLIPGGTEVVITMTKNNNNTVTLSYEATSSGVQDTSGIQDGVTLHCWNWSFAEIEANMATIAAQGYTAIQTSPVQVMKEDTVDSSVGTHWWVYYQPVDFKINDENGNALGTKSELESMIATAHEYGVKVIVDVVANHLGNKTGNDLADKIPEYLRKDEYWHDIKTNISSWDSRENMTQYCLSGLPDLNTSNKDVQNYVLNFLKECIDIGVDGFRFDMAKSIETPKDDASFASDFWPTVVGGAEDYAEEKGKDIYVYGEVLDDAKITISAYTEYMSVTDNGWGNHLRTNVVSGTAALVSGFYKSAAASNLVIWAESHDTYADGSSSGVSEFNINKTWALVAARADAMGLYLARPESTTQKLGVASKTAWTNPEVKAVNKFHNAFVGQSESISNENGISYVERGTSGVVLVQVAASRARATTVSVTAKAMADGEYVDQITGKTFTVANGKITGEIGDTGIAVVYNPANSVTVKETTGGQVTVSDETPATGTTVTITATPDSGKEVDTVTVTDEDGKAVTVTKQADGTYTYVQPAGDVTVEVTFKDEAPAPATTYNVTVKDATGGRVVVNDKAPEAGDTIIITVTPNTGKLIDKVTVTGKDGKAVAVTDKGDGTYTFVQPAGDVTVEVTFKDEAPAPATKYNVTVKDATGGKVEVSTKTPEAGTTVTITATPNSGKVVNKVTVTGKDGKAVTVTAKGDGTYTYVQPAGDVTVEVTFKDKQTTEDAVTPSTGDNSQVGLWIGIMAMSVLMLALLLLIKLKKRLAGE